MQHIFAIIAATGALTMPQTGIATNAPVAVSTCSVSDFLNTASVAEFGLTTPYRMLQLSFANTDDVVATQVTFDVMRDGSHTMVTDRGRFSKGVSIERLFDGNTGSYGDGAASCTVAAVTFADGRHWTAPGGPATTAATLR